MEAEIYDFVISIDDLRVLPETKFGLPKWIPLFIKNVVFIVFYILPNTNITVLLCLRKLFLGSFVLFIQIEKRTIVCDNI